MQSDTDTAGPTAERFNHAHGFFTDIGSRSRRRIAMLDDALGRLWMRQKLSGEEYYALRRYAHHWLAGGLCGAMQSLDLDRLSAHSQTGLSERRQDHRDAYHEAKASIGERPGLVADAVACHGCNLLEAGMILGYRSPYHAREHAQEVLRDAGYRLGVIWKDKGN